MFYDTNVFCEMTWLAARALCTGLEALGHRRFGRLRRGSEGGADHAPLTGACAGPNARP